MMSNDSISNNKRIAKNTMLLYVRMLLIMAVSLYTSRVILSALGETDFGIYNVVGGLVTMFSVLSGSLSAAISRFITFELGKGDTQKLKRIFSSSVTIQLILGGIIILVAETIGLWFLNCKMNIPAERMVAANWVFQFSIITFCINLFSVPYNAAIIAHEKMKVYAYIGLFETFGKLLVAFIISITLFDRLIFYSVLLTVISICVRIYYTVYCKRNFSECVYTLSWNKELLKEMFSFAGWNFIGAVSGVLRNQGVNILLNIFFGTTINAARGVSEQVHNAVMQFSQNFLTAATPQIIKTYSQGEAQKSYKLCASCSRFAFFLMLILSLPLIFETEFILDFWLNEYPDAVAVFVDFTLILIIVECLSFPLITLQRATGNIRNYQLVVGFLHLLNFPISYFFLSVGFEAFVTYIIAIVLSFLSLFARLIILKKTINISIIYFVKDVLVRILMPTLLSLLFAKLVSTFFDCHIVNIISILFVTLSLVIFIGLSKRELLFVREKLFRK